MKLIIITTALVSNSLLGWDYNSEKEDRIPREDSVIVPASHKYARLNPLKWLFLGKNYREEWSVPVKMPVFYLLSTKGGFTIEKMGGGEQTKSLHLVHKDGSEWVIRTVDKNVKGALPPKLQHTFIEDIVQDQISSAYPYAAMTTYDLSIALKIPAPTAELFYVLDDPALGKYREIFAHKVVLLYPKEITNKKVDTEPTDTIKYFIGQSPRYKLSQRKILTARLFDMIIADWDRHKGQWDWGIVDSANSFYIFPVPEDRDQAYFLSTGALAQIARLFGMPYLIGFRSKPIKLKQLNHKMHEFDRSFLNALTRSDWEKEIANVQKKLTDDVIERAVGKLPNEVYVISGEELKSKLKSRRDGLMKNGMKYYDYVAKKVIIATTEETETLLVHQYQDSTTVKIIRNDNKQRLYERTFFSCETKEIHFPNLDTSDKVIVKGKSGIRLYYGNTVNFRN